MTQLNISLPDSVYDWVSSQVKAGKFANNSDYIRELIMQVQQQQLLQQAITEGLESGISALSVTDIIKEAKIELKQDNGEDAGASSFAFNAERWNDE